MDTWTYVYWVGGIVVFAILWQWLVVAHYHERGRKAGINETSDAMIRGISRHYERDNEPLPEGVSKALDLLKERVAKQTQRKDQNDTSLIYLRALADEMGEACVQSGSDTGRRWQDPREGDYRIDLPMQSWMTLLSLAHRGFLHWMPHYTPMLEFHCRTKEEAEAGAAVVEALEFKIPKHIRGDPEYSNSLSRNMLVWDWDKRPVDANRPEPLQ